MDSNKINGQTKPKTTFQPTSTAGLGAKEKETGGMDDGKEVLIEEVGKELEPAKEVEKFVEVRKETVAIPPSVEKLGVKQVGPTAPVKAVPTITVPLADDQILSGLHVQITSALRWLAEFCLRQLKKAHIQLKVIHGKTVRVRR